MRSRLSRRLKKKFINNNNPEKYKSERDNDDKLFKLYLNIMHKTLLKKIFVDKTQ